MKQRDRKIFSLLIVFALFTIPACDHPAVFAPARDLESQTLVPADSTIILQVNISGGIAGVQQQLRVYENGLIVLEDDPTVGRRWHDRFDNEELAAMQRYFIENGFFLLNEKYVSNRVADAFYYDIYFRYDDLSGVVSTDFFDAPENLKRLVRWITDLNHRLVTQLDFRLALSADTLEQGGSLELELTVYNRSDSTVTLNFSDMQEFNFLAFPGQSKARRNPVPPEPVWTWDADKAFIQIMHRIDFPAGDSLKFTTTWNGQDNSGRFKTGTYLLAGELVSAPGGRTPWFRVNLVAGE